MQRGIRERLGEAARSLGAEISENSEIRLEVPRRPHGDLATALPLQLAPMLGRPPMAIAASLAAALREDARFAIEATEPGYLNLRLSDESLLEGLSSLWTMDIMPVEDASGRELFFAGLEQSAAGERESLDDPWYFLQVITARLFSLERLILEAGIVPKVEGPVAAEERLLLVGLNRWDPDSDRSGSVRYALELATMFQVFDRLCRIVSWERPGLRAALALATRRVLARSLGRHGIRLPDRM